MIQSLRLLERQCMVKWFIYLANDVLPHCSFSMLKSVAGLLWLTFFKEKSFQLRKVLLHRMSTSVQIVLINIVQTEKEAVFLDLHWKY